MPGGHLAELTGDDPPGHRADRVDVARVGDREAGSVERSDELRYSGAHNGAETISAENRRDVLDLVESLRT